MERNNILFRCSSLGHIMTEPKVKSETISETAKVHLIDVFISTVYGRRSDISNRYTIKGTLVEEDSMTLFSRVTKRYYVKNEESLANDYIKGTPDIITSLDVEDMEIIDIKSSWDIFTFMRAKFKNDIKKLYYWQLQGYMALTGAKKARLAYCLVNTPDQLLEDEKRKLWYKIGQPDKESPMWLDAVQEIEMMCIYDDIPMQERLHQISFERNDADIEKLYTKILACRKWMDENMFNVPERIDIEGV